MQKLQIKAVVGALLLSVSSVQAAETCDEVTSKIQNELTLYVSRRSSTASSASKKSIQDIYEQVLLKRVTSDPTLIERCPKLRSLLAIVEAGKTMKSDVAKASGGTERGSGGTERGSGGTERGSGGTERGSGGTERGSGGTERGSGGTERGSGGTERGFMANIFRSIFGGRTQSAALPSAATRRSAQIDQATALLGLATVSPADGLATQGLTAREAIAFEFTEKTRNLTLGEIRGRDVFEGMADREEFVPVAVTIQVRMPSEDGACPNLFAALETEVQDLNRGLRAGFEIVSRSSHEVGASQYMNSVLETLRESSSRIHEIRQTNCPGSIIVGVRFDSAANPALPASGVERE